MLSHGHDNRLVVRAGVDGTQTISALREPSRHLYIKLSIDSSAVHTLEERKVLGVRRRRLCERVKRLNDDVAVAHDLSILQLLGRGKVVLLGVHEVSGDEVVDGHGDRERGIDFEVGKVGWVDELARRHVVG